METKEIKITVKTTKGFRYEPPKGTPKPKIKFTSSVYDVFKDFELKDENK